MSEEKTMKNTEQKIPALRFPEFSGKWEEKRLGEIAKFSKGKNISKADIEPEGEIECIRYGELYTTYGEIIDEIISKTNLSRSELVFSQANDVIIPASGETNIDIATASCVVKNNIALGGDLNIIRSPLNGRFLAYNLNNKQKYKIAALAQGNAVVHLYPNHLEVLSVAFPSLPEQQKIADFLSAVDTRLQLLKDKKTKLEEYKRGVMQRIFSQELRFTRPDGSAYPDWEEKRLGELGTTYNGLSGKTAEDFGEGKPYIQYKQIFDNSKIDMNKCGFVNIVNGEKQNEVAYGDILFTTSSETPHEVGFSSVILDEVKNTYLNSFCFGFSPNSLTELYPSFSRYLFRSEIVRKDITTLAQGSTRYNMSKIEFLKIGTFIPCLDEQRQIADFLSAIDDKILLLGKKIASTEQYKKGLLQQMFV